MSTVRDIIYDSMLMLNMVASGEALDPNIAADALRRLNSMLSLWSAEGLMVYTYSRQVFPMTIGQASYTYGLTGNFNSARPVWFNMASVIPTSSAPTLEIPIDILSDQDWQGVSIKSISSTFPVCIHPRGDYPLNTIDVWPVPTAACDLVLYVPGQFTAYTNLSDVVSLPPGYEEAIVPNLASRCATMFGIPTPPDVMRMASISKDILKAQNLVVDTLRVDPSMCGNQSGPSTQAIRSKGYVCD